MIIFRETRVIRLQDIQQIIASVNEQVGEKILHPYLAKHFQTPDIDEDKLLLLISILDQLELTSSQIQNYAVSTMLIQIALDTHDLVADDNKTIHEKSRQTAQQLMVLAGDYYSGLYYKLLAESDSIELIKVLAHGIREINEHKIAVFHKEFTDIDNLMTHMKMIESSLLEQITRFFNVDVWNEIIENLLLVKRLFAERNRFIQTGSSILFDGLQAIIGPKKRHQLENEYKQSLLAICDRSIELSKQTLKTGVKQLPMINEFLKGRILALLNEHQSGVNIYAEEG